MGATPLSSRGRVSGKTALVTLASTAVLLMASGAQAVDFRHGELSGSLQSQFSFGYSVRISDPDKNNVSQAANAGRSIADDDWEQGSYPTGSFGDNQQDGQLNYGGGDVFSAPFRTMHELSMDWRNYGAFVRGNFFYDPVNTGFKEDALVYYPNGEDGFAELAGGDDRFSPNIRGDRQRPKGVEDQIGTRARLFDAYVYGDFTVADRMVTVRLGRQVLSWGESNFLQNGIAVINPINVNALRVAGSELRDAFLPQNMLYLQGDLFGDTSMEAFVQFEWEEYELEPRGSLFADDIAGRDGRAIVLGSGRYLKQDAMNVYDLSNPDTRLAMQQAGFDPDDNENAVAFGSPFYQPAMRPNEASNSGQWGVAIRQFLPQLGSSEVGFYYLNVHRRIPVISGYKHGGTNFEDIQDAEIRRVMENWHAETGDGIPHGAYFLEYPEDQKVYGISGNFLLPTGTSVGTEISHKPDMALQIHMPELSAAMTANAFGPDGPASSQIDGATDAAPGEYIPGFIERDVTQLQATFIHAVGPGNLFNARQLLMIGEIGGTYVHDMPDKSGPAETDGLRLATPEAPAPKGGSEVTPINAPDKQFADDWSWGYRLVAMLEYNNVFGSWNAAPMLAFNHDASGNSPQGYNFVHNRKSASVGVNFDYLARWDVGVTYAAFWGGYGNGTLHRDKDFVSAVVRYSF